MKRLAYLFLSAAVACGAAFAATAAKPTLKVTTLDGKAYDLSAQAGK